MQINLGLSRPLNTNYMPKSGGTFTGPVGHNSTMSVGNATFSYDSADDCVNITFA